MSPTFAIMLHLKPFSLKLLYYLTGIPLLFLLIFSKNYFLNHFPANLPWIGLFAILMVTRVLIEKEKYETGSIKSSWKTAVLALTAVLILGKVLYQIIL